MKKIVITVFVIFRVLVHAQNSISQEPMNITVPEPYCLTCNDSLPQLEYADVYRFNPNTWNNMSIDVVFAFTQGSKPGLVNISTLTMSEIQINKIIENKGILLHGPYNFFLTKDSSGFVLVIADKSKNGEITIQRQRSFSWKITKEKFSVKFGRLFVPKK